MYIYNYYTYTYNITSTDTFILCSAHKGNFTTKPMVISERFIDEMKTQKSLFATYIVELHRLFIITVKEVGMTVLFILLFALPFLPLHHYNENVLIVQL